MKRQRSLRTACSIGTMKTTHWSTHCAETPALLGVGVTRDAHGQGRGRGAAPPTLPDGPGKDAVQAQCTKCHALGLIANSGGFTSKAGSIPFARW